MQSGQNLVERGVINADDGGAIDVPHMLRREQLRDEATLSIGSAGNLSAASRLLVLTRARLAYRLKVSRKPAAA